MFDAEQAVVITGEVIEFRWTNPHCWIVMKNSDGEQWAIELSGTGLLQRQGWNSRTVMPGMAIRVVAHPHRDGSKIGHFVSVTLPDGTIIGETDPGGKLPGETPFPHP
jgi:hypothetical protein